MIEEWAKLNTVAKFHLSRGNFFCFWQFPQTSFSRRVENNTQASKDKLYIGATKLTAILNPFGYGRFFRPITHGEGGVVRPPPITHIENGFKRFLYAHIAYP